MHWPGHDVGLRVAGKRKGDELISRRYSLDEIDEGVERLGPGAVAPGDHGLEAPSPPGPRSPRGGGGTGPG